jgi:hypothetical protein
VAVSLLACLATLPLAAAHHVNGTWVLTVDLGGQGGDATFELEETEAGKLTGTYSGAVGSADVTGTVEGAKVTFSFDSPQAGKITYTGTVDGDSMEGTCEYGQLGTGTFKGSRKSE